MPEARPCRLVLSLFCNLKVRRPKAEGKTWCERSEAQSLQVAQAQRAEVSKPKARRRSRRAKAEGPRRRSRSVAPLTVSAKFNAQGFYARSARLARAGLPCPKASDGLPSSVKAFGLGSSGASLECARGYSQINARAWVCVYLEYYTQRWSLKSVVGVKGRHARDSFPALQGGNRHFGATCIARASARAGPRGRSQPLRPNFEGVAAVHIPPSYIYALNQTKSRS